MSRPRSSGTRGPGGAVSRFVRSAPATSALLALSLGGFLASFFAGALLPLSGLAFIAGRFTRAPWTAVTYPFVGETQPFFLLLGLWWLGMVSSELERRRGSGWIAALFLSSSAASAAAVWGWSLMADRPEAILAGLMLPLSGVTVAWCLSHPDRVVLFSLFIPMPGKILALVTVALVYFSYGPVLGLFAAAGCAVGWLFVRGRNVMPKRASGYAIPGIREERLSLVDRFRLWKARRRMKKVWDADDPDRFGPN